MTDLKPIIEREDFRPRSLPGVSWQLANTPEELEVIQRAAAEMNVNVTVLKQRGIGEEKAVMYTPLGHQGNFSESILSRGASHIRLNFPLDEKKIAPESGMIESFWNRVDAIKAEKVKPASA